MSKEIWKSVPGFAGKYQVSSEGNVRKIGDDLQVRMLKVSHIRPRESSNFNRVTLRDDKGVAKHYRVSKLVFEAFIGPVPQGMYIVHKNGDLRDDSVNNLAAMPPRKVGQINGGNSTRRKPVAKLSVRGEIIDVFPSARKAAAAAGMCWTTICDICNGIAGPMAGDGYLYRWDDEIDY